MAVEQYQPLLSALSISLILIAGWQMLTATPDQKDCTAPAKNSSLINSQLVPFLSATLIVMILITSEHWLLVLVN